MKHKCKSNMHHWKTIEGDHSICLKCKVESHEKAGLQPVAISPNNYEKLKKAGILEDREYYIFQTWGDIKAKIIANIIINDLSKHSNEQGCKIDGLGLGPYDVWWLAELIFYDILDRTKASKVINHFVEYGGEIKDIISELGLWPTLDNKLEGMINIVIADNPKIIEQILAGKEKAIGSLIGQLKKVDKNIDSKEAMNLLKEKIHE